MKVKNIRNILLSLLFAVGLCLCGCSTGDGSWTDLLHLEDETAGQQSATLEEIPEFSDQAYVVLNDNQPEFDESDYTTESFEQYSELDSLGRCGTAVANVGKDLMPTEKRGEITPVKPTGWHSVKYDCVEGKYLYNRCHLIGYQLSGENANKKNLLTGTRYLNIEGMLPFENEVADYVKETDNHVLYRVTPVYEGDDLVASGVQMEGWSVEDNGEGVCFNVYAYNNQPGVEIDYATGDSNLADAGSLENKSSEQEETKNESGESYIINTNTHKFHKPSCSSVADTKEENKETVTESRSELIEKGYEPCRRCHP